MTVGGDKLEYPHDTASPTVALIDTKLSINSTILGSCDKSVISNSPASGWISFF